VLFWLQLGDSNEDSRWLSGLSLAYGPSEEGSDELMGKPSWVRWLGFQQTHAIGGMTANLMVRGSPYNHTIQFNRSYPKTGGGEDIGFIFQFKQGVSIQKAWRLLGCGCPWSKCSTSLVAWRKYLQQPD
jgi:hypothetical protein